MEASIFTCYMASLTRPPSRHTILLASAAHFVTCHLLFLGAFGVPPFENLFPVMSWIFATYWVFFHFLAFRVPNMGTFEGPVMVFLLHPRAFVVYISGFLFAFCFSLSWFFPLWFLCAYCCSECSCAMSRALFLSLRWEVQLVPYQRDLGFWATMGPGEVCFVYAIV